MEFNILKDLQINDKGVYVPIFKKDLKISYPADGHDKVVKVEDKSFWFNHRNQIIKALLKRFSYSGSNPWFLDFGAGNGVVSAYLSKYIDFSIMALEPSPAGAFNCKKRQVEYVLNSHFEELSLADNSIPMVGMFDVLEHLENRNLVLSNLYRKMSPNGLVYISVPAYMWLWSVTDELSDHKLRYEKSTLQKELELCNFQVIYSSYFFSPLIIPTLFLRTLPSFFGMKVNPAETTDEDHGTNAGFFVKIIIWLLSLEKYFIDFGFSIPMGTSLIMVAQKNEEGVFS